MGDPTASVEFLQRLIRTESLPGHEQNAARLVHEEMTRLSYDEVRVDTAGNILGTVRGRGAAPAIMFNSHLDHVDIGDPSRWPFAPFGGELHDGVVWGRGAVDIKGPVAAQVHTLGRLLADGVRPPGDVHVAVVVQEEIGGVGSRFLAGRLDAPVVIIGEPSGNTLRRGHRGRVEATVHFRGRSVHASVPHLGVNPLAPVARFILQLERLEMRAHPELGASTVAPTLIRTDQSSLNVIPGEVWLTCDWRNVPGESEDEIRQRLLELAQGSCGGSAGCDVMVPTIDARTYTGYEARFTSHVPAFLTERDHPIVLSAERALRESIGLDGRSEVYHFATDGGFFAPYARAVIGFGPGDETLAHTVDERIDVAALETGIQGNLALAVAGLSLVC